MTYKCFQESLRGELMLTTIVVSNGKIGMSTEEVRSKCNSTVICSNGLCEQQRYQSQHEMGL